MARRSRFVEAADWRGADWVRGLGVAGGEQDTETDKLDRSKNSKQENTSESCKELMLRIRQGEARQGSLIYIAHFSNRAIQSALHKT